MRYDKDGFPIPPEFDAPARSARDGVAFDGIDAAGRRPGDRSTRSEERLGWPEDPRPRFGPQAPRPTASRKPWLVLAVIFGVLPAIVIPAALPTIREAVVQWSLEQARACEADGDLPGVIAELSRAIRWRGEGEAGLLCERAMFRLEDRDPTGALGDVAEASSAAPTAVQPWRVRALVHAVQEDAEAAVAAADMVVKLSSPGDVDALNHRAYVRALVGRDLPAALADIDRALAGMTESSPALLDTRGFILHLLGRHREAVDQLNVAINGLQQTRRQFNNLRGRVDDPVLLACRMRRLEHEWAVMLHHRALACRAIGLEEQAKQDFDLAARKGFDPARGIF